MRALLQRERKRRDLVDLSHPMPCSAILIAHASSPFWQILSAAEQAISRAEAEERKLAKLDDRSFLADVRPLLTAEETKKFDAKAERTAFKTVFSTFIRRIPGEAWKKTQKRARGFGMPELAED